MPWFSRLLDIQSSINLESPSPLLEWGIFFYSSLDNTSPIIEMFRNYKWFRLLHCNKCLNLYEKCSIFPKGIYVNGLSVVDRYFIGTLSVLCRGFIGVLLVIVYDLNRRKCPLKMFNFSCKNILYFFVISILQFIFSRINICVFRRKAVHLRDF